MPGGGVCAVLDYEVDVMAEYVAEMAVELVAPRSAITPAFRKFCSQILSSTRLPKTTILLGMNYLSKRVNGLKLNGPFHPHEGQVWRMLTIALLLGSKFLDDNTFQNRSWSDVSGIPVSELNKLEADWLNGINWSLYVNLERSQDYNAWLDNWSDWVKARKMAQASRERLAALTSPIQTDFNNNRPVRGLDVWHQQQVAEYERYSNLKRGEQAQQQQPAYRPQEVNWNQYSAGPWSSAPLTPPDSGYGTPEYPLSATSGNGQFYGDWFNRAFAPSRQNSVSNVYHHPTRHAAHYQGYYNNYVGHNIWEMNVAECNCANCTGPIKSQPYFAAAPAYGQAVLG